jgi:hypothetical protein
MDSNNLTRRSFMKKTTVITSAVIAAPLFFGLVNALDLKEKGIPYNASPSCNSYATGKNFRDFRDGDYCYKEWQCPDSGVAGGYRYCSPRNSSGTKQLDKCDSMDPTACPSHMYTPKPVGDPW